MEKIFKSKVIVFACDTYFSVVIGETNKLWENAKKTAKNSRIRKQLKISLSC